MQHLKNNACFFKNYSTGGLGGCSGVSGLRPKNVCICVDMCVALNVQGRCVYVSLSGPLWCCHIWAVSSSSPAFASLPLSPLDRPPPESLLSLQLETHAHFVSAAVHVLPVDQT